MSDTLFDADVPPAEGNTAQVYNHKPERKAPAETTSEAERKLLALSRHNRAALAANCILLFGYIFSLWFQIYEFNGRAREQTAINVYFLGFALIILSGIIELGVDVLSIRTVGHGRYHSDNARWNRVISTLFISAGVLDIVAFVYWINRRKDIENTVLLVSAYVLLVMAILVLYFQLNDLKTITWAKAIISDKVDLLANIVVLVVSVVGVVLRHMEASGKDFDDATDRMELSAMSLWLISAMLYVTTDVVRLHQGILD